MRYKFIIEKPTNKFNDLVMGIYEANEKGIYEFMVEYVAHSTSIYKYFKRLMLILAKSKSWEVESSIRQASKRIVVIKSTFNLENILEKQTFN